MAKILECVKVDSSSGCQHIIRGKTEEEVLRKAAEHAKEHGIREVTPELMELVKANMALLFLSKLLRWISSSEEEEGGSLKEQLKGAMLPPSAPMDKEGDQGKTGPEDGFHWTPLWRR
jgi:predicted small metal-binding protein